MKSNVNLEFTDTELVQFVEDQARRVVFSFLGGLFHHLNYHLDPAILSAVKEAVKSGVQIGVQAKPGTRGPFGPPPGSGYGYGPPPGYTAVQRGPMPPSGPVGPAQPQFDIQSLLQGLQSILAQGGQVPQQDNVRPIAEPTTVEHCFAIEETRQNEAGWACCRCAASNGLGRTRCRACGHQRCGAVITPPPSPVETPPESAP